MDWLSKLMGYVLFPLDFVLRPGSQFFWPTYVGAGVTALFLYLLVRRKKNLSLRAARELLLPTRLLTHDSTKLDFKLFLISAYYLMLQVLLVGATTFITVAGTVAALEGAFGATPMPVGPSWTVTIASMFLVFMAVEFGYWFAHFLMHKIPALWEFHKVHHSAEVLTPLTEWRQHPVELFLFAMLLGGASCVVQGPLVWFFGADAQMISPITANYVSMAFWYTILHLRHSELPIYATGTLGKIVQTPAHHQVHHSIDPAHFDKNMGYCLSVYDWVFGTLYVPAKGEKFTFGLGHQDSALETAVGSIVAPFSRATRIIWRQLGLGGKRVETQKAEG
jgi:sterol desaturase/sphingolipid hydroxylase (fatty acid hydroxylase superfamily)